MSSTEATAAAHGGAGHSDEHVMPVSLYLKIYGALLVMTAITVGVSMLDLGEPAIYVALAVAVIKGSLVAAYFMHLKYDAGFNRLIFGGSLLFLMIFFVITMIDLGSRGAVSEEQDTMFKRQEESTLKRLEARKKASKPTKASKPVAPKRPAPATKPASGAVPSP
jgi:caa(3)-type oxidase subunit IV